VVSASQRRQAVRHLQLQYKISERRGCQLTKLSRSAFRYQHRKSPQTALRERIKEIARTRIRYGYKRIHVRLKREGIHANKKRIHRLYCLEGLQLRPKRPRRHVSAAHRHVQQRPSKTRNEAWAMDFVADQLHDGSKLRVLTIVDIFTRECLAAELGFRLNSGNVVDVLTRITKARGRPKRIHCDNGSEFSGRVTD